MTLNEWISKPEKSGKKTCWCQFSPGVKGQRGSVNPGKGSAGHKGQAAPFAGATYCTGVGKMRNCQKGISLADAAYCQSAGITVWVRSSWKHRTFHGWKVLCLSHFYCMVSECHLSLSLSDMDYKNLVSRIKSAKKFSDSPKSITSTISAQKTLYHLRS